MNSKITVLNEDNYKYLIYSSIDEGKRNKLLSGMLKNNTITQLLETFWDEDNKEKCEYDVTDYKSLTEYFEGEVERDVMLPVIVRMVENLKELRKYFLMETDILLDKDYIFLNSNMEVKMLGAAEVMASSNQVITLIKDIMDNTQWKKTEKKDYVQIINTLIAKENVTYDEIINCINEIMQSPVEYEEVIEPVVEPVVEPRAEEVVEPVAPSVAEPVVADVPPTPPVSSVVPDVPPTPPTPPVVPDAPPTPPVPPVVSSVPPVALSQEPDDDFDGDFGETTVLGISNQPMIFPLLTRIKTGEKIVINKTEFAIGKDPSRVDYCIFDNSAISRLHAKIICKNGEFFVVDNRSTNHVFVNGMLIDANVEVRLTHGARVRFGDEDFEFRFQ